ncbi:hypothetical protein FHS78_001649 [Parvibaculum indicum]|uniref:TIGR03862 family flavoprotein n=1 Tax=Parvibaculum indicum TaxID=562969 RepID=UPI0014223602|nr:TIGR03862 family flavoprotein [Parvibaculum indicum]NIJ41362.1 hypothetical protein [Parvibaculum indicum]
MKEDSPKAIIIGGGPAGLMAAETIADRAPGVAVHVYDAMPSFGRKLLMAGRGGLNITHSEPFDAFLVRYGEAADWLEPALRAFGPKEVIAWAESLGQKTFIGSSGRVFPESFKASPLLRAWLRRLNEKSVALHTRHRWTGWDDTNALTFDTPEGEIRIAPDATVLALGGASWPRLGARGDWTGLLAAQGVDIRPFRPANCGFETVWSAHMRERFAGAPVKPVALTVAGNRLEGEFVVTASGVEGGAIYALSRLLRDEIERSGEATLRLDLAPDRSRERLVRDLSRPRGKASLANHLRKAAGISGVRAALLRECAAKEAFLSPETLADAIKALPLRLDKPSSMESAISVAGGIAQDALDGAMMLKALPGVFCAGEMLDWEAPTGGYLLTACLATGLRAGLGASRQLSPSISGSGDDPTGT